MNTHSLALTTGDQLPLVGFGLWKVPNATAPELVRQALRAGYRHLDCACDYGNEVEVGLGIHAAIAANECRRDELWVTSKLWNTYHACEHVRMACERTLQDLRLDYLDLYLVHFPIAQAFVPLETRYPPGWFFDPHQSQPKMELARVPFAETWAAMEELVTAGLVRNIGVSNVGTAMLRDVLSYARIPPAVLQIELHPYLTQEKLVRFARENRIAVTGFSPLGAGSYVPLGMAKASESVLNEVAVTATSQHHGKTPAQIVLRWGVQRGTSVVPKTSRPERLAENLAIFDFELTPSEMQAIHALNRNRRFNDPGEFCEGAFNTFCPIYE